MVRKIAISAAIALAAIPMSAVANTSNDQRCDAASTAEDDVQEAVYCSLAAQEYAVMANNESGEDRVLDLSCEAYDLKFAADGYRVFDPKKSLRLYSAAKFVLKSILIDHSTNGRVTLLADIITSETNLRLKMIEGDNGN